jgi:hypothetical protein
LVLGWYSYHQRVQIITKTEQVKALTDTVTFYKTKTGASGATRRIFVGSKDEVLTVLKSTDAEAYQNIKNTAGIKSYTNFTTITRIDTVVKADTVYITKDSTGTVNHYLSKEIIEPKGFYTAKVDVKNDTVALKLQMTDKFNVITKDKSNGLFKPKSYVVTVENTNPYVNITGLKSFEIQPKNRHTAIKIGGVVAIEAVFSRLIKLYYGLNNYHDWA